MSDNERIKNLPPMVAMAIDELDREASRRKRSLFPEQGGIVKLTQGQYQILRQRIVDTAYSTRNG